MEANGAHNDEYSIWKLHDIFCSMARLIRTWNKNSPHWMTTDMLTSPYRMSMKKQVRDIGPGAEKGNPIYEWNGTDTPRTMKQLDAEGRILYSRKLGIPAQSVSGRNAWSTCPTYGTDIILVVWFNTERLGYPTQKPLALLERIVQASSNEGDVVLDPFCGCGTAIAAAQKLNRSWIGIDITHLAVALMKNRLKTAFNILPGQDYQVVGEPVDVGSARALAEQDRFQFEFWAMSLLEAFPREQKKRGADQGVDGVVYFIDGPRRAVNKAVVQVKSGRVSSPLIRDLVGTVEREKAAMGLFITLEEPTRDMRTEAVSAGFYHSDLWQTDYPKIQIRTVGELLEGKGFEVPRHPQTYQPAQRITRAEGEQAAWTRPPPGVS